MKCKWELWKNNSLKKSDFPQLWNSYFDFVLIWIDLEEFHVDSSGNLKHLPMLKNKHAKGLGILQHLPLEQIHLKHLPRVPNLTTVFLVKEQFSLYR